MALKAPPIQGLTLPSLKPSSSSSSSWNTNRPCMVKAPPQKSSFLGNQVGAVRVTQLRLVYYDRLRCNGLGGGAAGAGVNLFERLARIIKSYASAILSFFEDPEKIIDQAVNDMNEDLTRMRHATAPIMASQKQLENKYKAAQQSSDDWYKKAQLALAKGDEDLAREALKRRKSFADNANAFKAQLDQQKCMVDNLVSNTRMLESKIEEAKSKKDGLKARSAAAKTAIQVQEMIGTVNTSSALSAFEKMEEKVLTMESQAEALNQLNFDEIDGKFKMLESSLEDDLAELKKEVSVSSKKGELPPGRTVGPNVLAFQKSDVLNEFKMLESSLEDDLAKLKKEVPVSSKKVVELEVIACHEEDVTRLLNEMRRHAKNF